MKDKKAREGIAGLERVIDRLIRGRWSVNFDIKDEPSCINSRITRDYTTSHLWVYLDQVLVFSCSPPDERVSDAFIEGLNCGLKKEYKGEGSK